MAKYILKRFIQMVISIFVLGTVVFILSRVTGNPVDLLLPPDASPEQRQTMIAQLGLDKPYHVQYIEFITGAIQGDFGNSVRYGKPAMKLVMERFPNTIKLAAVAFLFAVLISIPLGVLAGANRGKPFDSTARLLAVIGVAAPSFWVGVMLIQAFSVKLGWLPSARMGGFTSYILPAFSMCLFMLAGMTRLLRSSMVELLDTEFVKLARIKGVSRQKVIWKHCLRNALIPVMTFAGMYLGLLLTGGVVVETVFAWPGMGRLAYDGIVFRDYPLVQAVIITKGVIIILINLLVDIMYAYVDPRVRSDTR